MVFVREKYTASPRHVRSIISHRSSTEFVAKVPDTSDNKLAMQVNLTPRSHVGLAVASNTKIKMLNS